MSIEENIAQLKARITDAARRAERNPDEIHIVAVSKTIPVPKIEQAITHGITILGENRVQEAKTKFPFIGSKVAWHMVGHLQTNKVRDALKIFTLIHSLDSVKLAREIDKRANAPIDCLIEVNTSQESTKFGIEPENAISFYEALKDFNNLNIKGLMTIGPGWAIQDKEASRPCFRRLVSLKNHIEKTCKCSVPILSMGMTSDYEIAIEEGANLIRVGTAIFGPRE
ncbi:MAG: YggS family pyridoxal phosphate-dependent enzyme [bacterium]